MLCTSYFSLRQNLARELRLASMYSFSLSWDHICITVLSCIFFLLINWSLGTLMMVLPYLSSPGSSSRNGENNLYNEQVLFCALPLPSDFCCHLRLARVLLKESCSLVVVLSALPLYVRWTRHGHRHIWLGISSLVQCLLVGRMIFFFLSKDDFKVRNFTECPKENLFY